MAGANEDDAPIDVNQTDKTKKAVILLIILSVLVMVLTPVITIFAIRMMTQKKEQPVQVKRNVTKEIVLPQVQVNVAGTNGTRFVQIQIVATISDPEMACLFTDQTPENDRGKLKRILATVINIISDKNLTALVSKEAKVKLAHELKTAVNDLLYEDSEGIVSDIYFYGFLIQ